jgi:hypothetical protein
MLTTWDNRYALTRKIHVERISSAHFRDKCNKKIEQTQNNAVFCDVVPCGFNTNRRPSESSVFIRTTRRHIPEDGILHSHRRENLKSYKRLSNCMSAWGWPTGAETYSGYKNKIKTNILEILLRGTVPLKSLSNAHNRMQHTKKKTLWFESASELYRPSDRHLSAKWLPTCADRKCHVVSVTDPSGRISRFSRQEPLLSYQVAPQFVLTRLTAPRSRSTTFFFSW